MCAETPRMCTGKCVYITGILKLSVCVLKRVCVYVRVCILTLHVCVLKRVYISTETS